MLAINPRAANRNRQPDRVEFILHSVMQALSDVERIVPTGKTVAEFNSEYGEKIRENMTFNGGPGKPTVTMELSQYGGTLTRAVDTLQEVIAMCLEHIKKENGGTYPPEYTVLEHELRRYTVQVCHPNYKKSRVCHVTAYSEGTAHKHAIEIIESIYPRWAGAHLDVTTLTVNPIFPR